MCECCCGFAVFGCLWIGNLTLPPLEPRALARQRRDRQGQGGVHVHVASWLRGRFVVGPFRAFSRPLGSFRFWPKRPARTHAQSSQSSQLSASTVRLAGSPTASIPGLPVDSPTAAERLGLASPRSSIAARPPPPVLAFCVPWLVIFLALVRCQQRWLLTGRVQSHPIPSIHPTFGPSPPPPPPARRPSAPPPPDHLLPGHRLT